MKIDIIVPFFNALNTIDKTLASLVMQKLDPGDELHVAVVDDASTGCTAEEIAAALSKWKPFLDIDLICKDTNEGVGRTRQAGIEFTDGDVYMIVDSDDVLGSPFAVRELARKMKETDCNMAMGVFVEEDPSGCYHTHGENYVWCHGKMYRRSFIESSGLYFNWTRCNEDMGYHTVFHALTDKVVFIPQVVYIWQDNSGSTVRKNADGYAYDYGWHDLIKNYTWAVLQMQEHGVPEETILHNVALMIVRLYWSSEEAHFHFPEKDDENDARVQEFYDIAAKEYVKQGKLDYTALCLVYQVITAEDKFDVIPEKTFGEFLTGLGFFTDAERGK